MESIGFRPEERHADDWPTVDVARPGLWPACDTFIVVGDLVGYQFPIDDSRWRWRDPLIKMDARRRCLAEAFSTLNAASLGEFVATFGPVFIQGIDFGAVIPSWTDSLLAIEDAVAHFRAVVALADTLAVNPNADGDARRKIAAYLSSPAITIGTVVDDRGRFGRSVALRSLLDAVRWQLLEQLMRRPTRSRVDPDQPDPVFRLPWCGYCGGAIFGTRLVEDKVNRWHGGCAAAGQARRWRGKRRAR